MPRVSGPLPCPFCGETPKVHECMPDLWHVWCRNTRCCANPQTTAASRSSAVRRWNRRKERSAA